MLIQGDGGGVPARAFVTGGRTGANLVDRLLAHTEQASAHTPKKQKNKRCSDWDYNLSALPTSHGASEQFRGRAIPYRTNLWVNLAEDGVRRN